MEWYILAIIILGILLLLLAMGAHIAFALMAVGVGGLSILMGAKPAFSVLGHQAYSTSTNFILLAVPLFIFMAEVILFSGVANQAFDTASKWFSRLPGGLAVASIYACAGFGAVSGASLAACATIGGAAIPEMINRGYDKRLATGSVAAGGALAILIPPSIPMIIYAFVAEESVGKLFLGGLIPGLLLATMMALYVIFYVVKQPSLAPAVRGVSWSDRLKAIPGVSGLVVLVVLVLGTIYLGVATPTEAAGVGATGALILALIMKRLNWTNLRPALLATMRITSFVLALMIGATTFGQLLSAFYIPQELASLITGLPVSRWVILILIQILLVFLGMFLDPASIIVLTAPILVPIVSGLGFDGVWFGVLFTINMEMAMITPPVGLNLYLIHGISRQYGVSIGDVLRGALPFMLAELACLGLVIGVPELALFLPNLMR